jgi:hypothetical protein
VIADGKREIKSQCFGPDVDAEWRRESLLDEWSQNQGIHPARKIKVGGLERTFGNGPWFEVSQNLEARAGGRLRKKKRRERCGLSGASSRSSHAGWTAADTLDLFPGTSLGLCALVSPEVACRLGHLTGSWQVL